MLSSTTAHRKLSKLTPACVSIRKRNCSEKADNDRHCGSTANDKKTSLFREYYGIMYLLVRKSLLLMIMMMMIMKKTTMTQLVTKRISAHVSYVA